MHSTTQTINRINKLLHLYIVLWFNMGCLYIIYDNDKQIIFTKILDVSTKVISFFVSTSVPPDTFSSSPRCNTVRRRVVTHLKFPLTHLKFQD